MYNLRVFLIYTFFLREKHFKVTGMVICTLRTYGYSTILLWLIRWKHATGAIYSGVQSIKVDFSKGVKGKKWLLLYAES